MTNVDVNVKLTSRVAIRLEVKFFGPSHVRVSVETDSDQLNVRCLRSENIGTSRDVSVDVTENYTVRVASNFPQTHAGIVFYSNMSDI